MNFELMFNSFPKLLNAAGVTLKLLSASLIAGLLVFMTFSNLSKFLFEKIMPKIFPDIHIVKCNTIRNKALNILNKAINKKKLGIIPENIKNLPNRVKL